MTIKMRMLPFIDTSDIEDDGHLKTVEEVIDIMNKFNNGLYNTETFIIAGINNGEISTRPILDESTLVKTKYNVLIPNYTILNLLVDRYNLNERYARSLLEDK